MTYYIYRIKLKRGEAWRVLVPGHKEKHFNDDKLGGREKSLAAAVSYRDSLASGVKKRAPYKVKGKSPSGVPGVSKYMDRGVWRGWKVSWGKPPQQRRSFPLGDYGSYEKALAAAVAFRKEKEREMDKGEGQ